MLRAALIIIAIGLGVGGLFLIGTGEPGGIAMLIASALFLIGTLYERVRYKRLMHKAPGPNFQRTAERFVDPETGKTVTVWTDPATGERAYVED